MADQPPRKPDGEAAPGPGRSAVERLIDEIVDDTFPASDPPAWGVAASRLERSQEADQAALNVTGEGPERKSFTVPAGDASHPLALRDKRGGPLGRGAAQ